MLRLLMICACALSSAAALQMTPTIRRAPAPVAPRLHAAPLMQGGAPEMADGAGVVAVFGGLVMILTAGLPILFLSKDGANEMDAKLAKANKMAGLEQGLASEMGEEEFAKMMEEGGMEEVPDEAPPPAP